MRKNLFKVVLPAIFMISSAQADFNAGFKSNFKSDFTVDESGAQDQDRNPREYVTGMISTQMSRSLECQAKSGYENSDLFFKIYKLEKADLTAEKTVQVALSELVEGDLAQTVQAPIVSPIPLATYQKSLAQTLLQFHTDSWSNDSKCQGITTSMIKSYDLLTPQDAQYFEIRAETRFGGARLFALQAHASSQILVYGYTFSE